MPTKEASVNRNVGIVNKQYSLSQLSFVEQCTDTVVPQDDKAGDVLLVNSL
jgi:hypothetical protein